jgi:hypothetical protein
MANMQLTDVFFFHSNRYDYHLQTVAEVIVNITELNCRTYILLH